MALESSLNNSRTPDANPNKSKSTTEYLVNSSLATSTNMAETTGTFSFLYDSSISNTIKDIKDESNNLYVTKISNYNNYYYKPSHTRSGASPASGYSSAMNMYYDNWERSWYSSQGYSNAGKFDDGTVLANCVGWANGRVIEVWNRALKSGYIKYDSSKQSYVLKNGAAIEGKVYDGQNTGSLGVGTRPPACNAVNFYKYWPTAVGWSKGPEPKVGALIVWGAHYSTEGNPGHVAFVEKVEDNGDIIISESSAANSGIHWLVQTYTLRKSNNYQRYYDHVLVGFCYSPVCQLASANDARTLVEFGGIIDPSSEDIEAYEKALENLRGVKIQKEFKVNDIVKIVWLGCKDPNGNYAEIKNRVNNNGLIGIICKKIDGATYPYAVKALNSNKIVGYYKWNCLLLADVEANDDVV